MMGRRAEGEGVMKCFNVMLKHEQYPGCNQFKLHLDMGGHYLWRCIFDKCNKCTCHQIL